MNYLVLGANSYLGDYIYHKLKSAGENVVGTVHSIELAEFVSFNIISDDIQELLDYRIKFPDNEAKTAFFCIAQSNIDKCKLEYDYSYNLNVIKTKQLLSELQERGYYTIFFSSDNVFDGIIGNYTEESKTNAINDYGKMKEEIEYFISENLTNTCIFRCSKIIGIEESEKNLLTEYQNLINENKKIKCIKGNILSFVLNDDVYRACKEAVKYNLHGLFNIVGNESLSRKELATMFCKIAGADLAVVEDCSIDDLPVKEKSRPLNVSMKNNKITENTGLKFTPIKDTLRRYIDRNMTITNNNDKELELWNKYGATQKDSGCITLGPHSSYQWNNSRRHLIFSAARYKFAMKMIGNMYEPDEKEILDLGCSDGFGTYYVAEYAKSVLGVDFDKEAIEYAKIAHENSNIKFKLENFLNNKYGDYDGIVSFDVLEHIYPENVNSYMQTVLINLKDNGTFVVGTPSLETQQYSKENVTGAHVNVYRGEELYNMLKQYFWNVYLFTQNDEVIHTGHLRMANYLIAVCSNKKGDK